jgi:hypothetical protein
MEYVLSLGHRLLRQDACRDGVAKQEEYQQNAYELAEGVHGELVLSRFWSRAGGPAIFADSRRVGHCCRLLQISVWGTRYFHRAVWHVLTEHSLPGLLEPLLVPGAWRQVSPENYPIPHGGSKTRLGWGVCQRSRIINEG